MKMEKSTFYAPPHSYRFSQIPYISHNFPRQSDVTEAATFYCFKLYFFSELIFYVILASCFYVFICQVKAKNAEITQFTIHSVFGENVRLVAKVVQWCRKLVCIVRQKKEENLAFGEKHIIFFSRNEEHFVNTQKRRLMPV